MSNIKYIVIHHEAPPQIINGDRFDSVDAYHKAKGWQGIGYTWFIEKSGVLKAGRKEGAGGAHTVGHNLDSIGVCLAGNFDLEMPTLSQIETLKKLIKEKMAQYSIPIENVVPHRYFATATLDGKAFIRNDTAWKTWDGCKPYKSCWGSKLTDNWLKDLITDKPSFSTPNPLKGEILAELEALKVSVENIINKINKI